MKMKDLKRVMIALFALPALALTSHGASSDQGPEDSNAELANFYKAHCQACHGPKGDKLFNANLAEARMIEIILKGTPGQKPVAMPGFEAKGMTAPEAAELAKYMKSLRTSAE